MDWHDSEEQSDDDTTHDAQTASGRKRSSRACDQCRKTKSKCERGPKDSTSCKSCTIAATTCTFLGPSYKRGPPKGYIHAIEQRWHQVESLLGAIMQCPDSRVQSVVSDMQQDELAREILARVDMGPYGPSGRISQPNAATKEDFFASVLRSNGTTGPPQSAREASRSRRQSRVSREKVSSIQDRGLSTVPTQEWQDALARRLAHAGSTPTASPNSNSFSTSNGHLSQRRRLNSPSANAQMPDWNNMYTMEAEDDGDIMQDPIDRMGELSLDENHEIRYHGRASGLHLLGINGRTDDRHEGGVWTLPMARVWPPSKSHLLGLSQEEPISDPALPSIDIQDRLIQIYFTYVHPSFPVVHKTRFLTEYQTRLQGDASSPSSQGSPKPEPQQRISALLLLSMFSIAARFHDLDHDMPYPGNGKMWDAGATYFDRAKALLMQSFYQSRPSTVQSLLLLGYREFGIGSMEQGWIYIGMGIRMAVDLGLNCNSESWKIHGHELFTPQERQTRRQIWWSCCLADRYGSVYMGRPVFIRDGDFDTPVPEVYADDCALWQPLSDDAISYPPTPSHIMKTFAVGSRLTVIVGAVVTQIYPVRAPPERPGRAVLAKLESDLDQWYVSLPDELRFDSANKRNPPPPHILFLHIRYWGGVLLLHRAFIPNWKGPESTPRHSTKELKAFDLSQSAATHLSSIVTVFRETFTLKRVSPFLTSFIFSAGIMHLLTLTLRPSNVQASVGLQQILAALKDMEVVWPSAARAWELIHGVKIGFENAQPTRSDSSDRVKRVADDAFGPEKTSDMLQQEAFGMQRQLQPQATNGADSGVQDLSTRIMAHFLGLDVPGVEASTSFYPGYEWWPRANPNNPQIQTQRQGGLQTSSPIDMLPQGSVPYVGQSAAETWGNVPTDSSIPYSYGYENYSI